LIAATPATRQAARWAYATHQISTGHAPEALGALQVMAQDEPDLALVASYQLALGAAFAELGRPTEALAALSGAALQPNPEACAWRMTAFVRGHLGAQALGQLRCALPALNARKVKDRTPFLLSIAHVAIGLGQPAGARQLLEAIPEGDPAANVLRGRAEIALGQRQLGMLLLAKVKRNGNIEQRLDAELSVLEEGARSGTLSAPAVARLRQIRFVWRGGDIEQRALQLGYAIARRAHDFHATLEAGATLFRYFGGGPDRLTLVGELRETLAATLAPDNPLPLDQVAGLYWDYRDLSPAGAEGDLLVTQLADRLQAAALYERAAELLDHQLQTRTRDIAQGPLSARVASLFILAGKPKRALAAIRDTEGNSYPDDMLWARHRVEAVALDQLGRTNEALAVLQDVPDGEAIRGELSWRRQDWKALADTHVPTASIATMTEVDQARVLRLAVALAMLGREGDLARLRAVYGKAFDRQPTAPAFDALTAAVGAVDPATISAAMTAIPSASPAGSIADLIDAAPQVAGNRGG
jgi:tetratricopeptide (TPR) repeat protein